MSLNELMYAKDLCQAAETSLIGLPKSMRRALSDEEAKKLEAEGKALAEHRARITRARVIVDLAEKLLIAGNHTVETAFMVATDAAERAQAILDEAAKE